MRPALHRMSSLHQIAAVEAQRVARSGRGFSIVRLAPVGWAALEDELDALEGLVGSHVRGTDFVQRVREREVGIVLIESVGEEAAAAAARVRVVAATQLPKLDLKVGWASVGPGHLASWQEAWRWAGQVLVGEAARAAA